MKIILREDSRDKVFKKMFGQVVTLPDEYNADSSLPDDVQPIGDVKCTCYTTCGIAEDQEKREFDINDLWQRIPSNQFGAEPRDVLKEAVSKGLLPQGQKDRVKDWKSFWSAKDGLKDTFDNVRSAIYMSQSPVGVALYWCQEWLNVPEMGVMPLGKTQLNGHMFQVEGWKNLYGTPYLIVEAWIGRKLLMDRNVFNDAMSKYGTQAWVLSTAEIDEKRTKTILETIRDLCINVIIKMKELLVLKQQPNQPPSKPTNDYQEVKETIMKPTYEWDTQEKARHSVRVICDEEGLTVGQKNELCGTVGGESNWKPRATGKPNKNGSRDYGIVQLNDHFWIGEGKLYPNIEAVYNDPEGCIRWMCKQWKAGKKNWWYAYKNGSYKQYLNPKFDNNGNLL